ncbi:DUF2946 domain-containing protein [Stenotrophomonas sp. TWI700]|jgi:hypothetical protein|uniref:DUF2946 domain-containing protein n=1 Tax=Stenotrophomonas TaxID=40323 RepID=UPI00320A5B25
MSRSRVHAAQRQTATNRRNRAKKVHFRRESRQPCLTIGPVHASLLHRWLHAWAFLAIALVIVAPMVSRALAPVTAPVIEASPAPHPHAAHHAMTDADAHAGHHAHHDKDQGEARPAAEAPADPHANHDMGVECEYCLIAARLISLLVALLLLLTQWPAVFRSLSGLVERRRAPAQGTLGARGPPVLVC